MKDNQKYQLNYNLLLSLMSPRFELSGPTIGVPLIGFSLDFLSPQPLALLAIFRHFKTEMGDF